ncbi:family 2 glycosyl transferase [Catenovulum sp. 2E275]|uniref:family 2 glycosyl transferase n=1 Tax=Catenovulum sp. 2E275 TaxID=2980497 RepID=UPI0021D029D0|nr:family 2 glycosyl transferase [Catenovulum sp. 2E275]MCU4676656.1 family 2 glycosyl transferase [Catenovulum sp. 2E275]
MSQDKHWSSIKERGSVFGIQTLLVCYRILGKRVFQVLFFPVMLYFYLTGGAARSAINQYWQQLTLSQAQPRLNFWQTHYKSFKTFYSFGLAIVDKFGAWTGKINLSDLEIVNQAAYDGLMSEKGCVVLSSHLGNMEVCRALFRNRKTDKKLNIITYNAHAQAFNQVLNKLDPNSGINFIHVDQFGPADTILIKQKIDNGEVVVIFADRTSVNNPASVKLAPFLNKPAPFAIGPFALASVMECPVYLMLCTKSETNGRYQAHVELFTQQVKISRKMRQAHLQSMIEQYAQRLSYYCQKSPYQWYNFFNFWQQSDLTESEQNK